MPLILLSENNTHANLSTGHELVNLLEAPTLPTRFGVTADFSDLTNTTGDMELKVEVLDLSNLSYGTHTVTAARVATAGSPNRGRVEFDKLFLVPAGFKAKVKIKSLVAGDTQVNTTVYVYDPNYPTAAGETRSAVTPTISMATYSNLGYAVGGQMTFSVGANRGATVGCRVRDKNKNSVPLELWLFRVSTTTGLGNNTVFDPDDNQLANLAGVLRINDWFIADLNSIGHAENLPLSFADLTGGAIYGWLVNRGAPIYASTSDITVELESLPG